MDFDKPLPKVGGYVIYATMLDYLDTFVHQYTQAHKGEYPSLRMTTDMMLNLLGDAIDELEDHLLELSKKGESEVFDSRQVGLFVDKDEYGDAYERSPYNYGIGKSSSTPEEPEELKPFTLSSKSDKDWLRSTGINPE
jgi:hypothetical protein